MTISFLASYATTGRREIWPLIVVAGLLVLVVTGLVVAQLTDPDRRHRAAERRALIAGVPSDQSGPDRADSAAPNADGTPEQPADLDLPHQDRRTE
ncbi:hypothetical protein I4I73_06580 [Pseudonocardia sp. KRD-184]|uniref:Uncharacterized protein n=1 Tax=Pseudonocardia oceani TaxID=2792013 RepID=A0ABS6U2X1_9PSEU|nr:hypothetical protein [Pseudonocardia oceani]MBW0088726.1 hypothetical protein [Pseudonocardia oceani]MBW0095665.1 hypothetical protein [Pseudonocardia oceani]MBW0121850.1 hypothetical protein [Pseudonocardia oceani]MBW0126594.1 hypothetical protein [Pseudonocardia oceani]